MRDTSVFHPPKEGDGRNRDVFPLPFLSDGGGCNHRVSRSVERRISRRSAICQRANLAVAALNSMFFGLGKHYARREVDDLRALPSCQREVMNRILKDVTDIGAPPDNACRMGALQALRAVSSSYVEPEPGVGSVVSMSLDQLSLPSGKVASVCLTDHLDENLKSMVANFEDTMLQDANIWTDIEEQAALVPPYNDKMLETRSGYLQFLERLYSSGILSFTSTCRGRVGAFCVSKKPKLVDGSLMPRQRLVLDCRQTNLVFRPPPHTALGSLAAVGQLTLDKGQELFVAGADIRDCFYAVDCPPGMSDFFCLASDISYEEALKISNGSISLDFQYRRIVPCIKVLPMGFNWSFFLIQSLHECATLSSLSIARTSLILDGQPPPKLSDGKVVSMPYCDDIHVISTDPVLCQDGCDRIMDDLRTMGFELHEETVACNECQTLGGVIDGKRGTVRPTKTRLWRIILAFEYITYSKVSVNLIQRLLGHAMTVCVLNRSGMSIFRHLYDFVEKGGAPRYLNNSKRREALNFIGVLPMLYSNMRREWSPVLTATDASPEGFGIVERQMGEHAAEALGAWNERWRFQRLHPSEWAPRSRALGKDVFGDMGSVRGFTEEVDDLNNYRDNPDFPEVPSSVLDVKHWKTVKMGKWKHKHEHITLKEGRALVIALRRLSRSSHHRGKAHVFLIDNMALCFAVHKGRAHSYDLLRIMQQIGSICIATGISVFPRWIPSELSCADGPSRGQILPGALCKSEQQASVSAHLPSWGASEEAHDEEGVQELEAFSERTVQFGSEENESRAALERSQEDCGHQAPPFSASSGGGDGGPRSGASGQEQQADETGVEERVSGEPQPVSVVLRQVQGLLCGERGRMASSQRPGRPDSGRLHGRPVCQRKIFPRRGKAAGSPGIQVCAVQKHDSQKQKGLKRLEKSCSSNESPPFASSAHDRNGHAVVGRRVDGYGLDDTGGIRVVSQTGRGHRTMSKACNPASESCRITIRSNSCGHSRSRGTKARQDRDLRQLSAIRQAFNQVDWPAAVGQGKGAPKERLQDLHVQVGRVQKSFCQGWRSLRGARVASLPDAPRWRHRRFDIEAPRLSRGQDQGQMAHRSVSASLCQSGSGAAAPQQSERTEPPVLPMGRSNVGESIQGSTGTQEGQPVRQIDVFSLHKRPRRFGLEIFAGSARISQTMCDQAQCVYPIDICLFSSHDVLQPWLEQKIVGWISQGRITFLWFGMPCTTFSRARKYDGLGPGPLRTLGYLHGLPTLNKRDRAKVLEGDELLRFMLRILRLCISNKVPFIVENPLTSMLWDMAEMHTFILAHNPSFVSLDYCAYGEPWKKPTKLMYSGIDLSSLGKRCQSCNHVCSFTHKRHVPLRGVNEDGIFWTLIAQPYPWSLCKAFGTLASSLRG